ncbi:MAG TPA: SdpI family protein [Chthonomonadaceae bacterium]|nr:SdpI family protein [Chthonomonadaceae bacterium]
MLPFVILYTLIGLLFMGLSVPLIQKRIKPNPWYGFRVPKTLSDERIWYAANAYSGVTLFLAGAAIALSALVLAPVAWLFRLGPGGYVFGCTLVILGSLLWSLVLSFRYLSKL